MLNYYSKFIFFVFSVVCALSFAPDSSSGKQSNTDPGPAATVVSIFCEQSALGIFLSSETAAFAWPYLFYKDGPGWDTVYVIDGFKIVSEKYSGKTAYVDVRYHITGAPENDSQTLKKTDRYKTVKFKLVLSDNLWKIKDEPKYEIPPPHVYMNVFKTHQLKLKAD